MEEKDDSLNQSINQSLNHKAVCRTAPATPGLFITQEIQSSQWRESSVNWEERLDRPVHGVVLHEGCKALVEPEVAPPVDRHQVAKPLVGNLVGHN